MEGTVWPEGIQGIEEQAGDTHSTGERVSYLQIVAEPLERSALVWKDPFDEMAHARTEQREAERPMSRRCEQRISTCPPSL